MLKKGRTSMQIALSKSIIKVLNEKYITFRGNKLEIIEENLAHWVKEELEKFIKNIKEMDNYENY